nr:Ger(x)C family spore germination protein [Bacillus cereus]
MLFCLVLCTGCWDQYLMKDVALVTALALDQDENGRLIATASLPRVPTEKGGISKATEYVISSVANTPRENRIKLHTKISGTYDTAKLLVLLVGDSLAKQDVFSDLDAIYRDPKGALDAKMVLVKGMAQKVMKKVKIKDETFSEYLSRTLQNAENSNILPNENMRSIHSKLLDPGQDFMLPYIQMDSSQSRIEIQGLGMFHHHTYSGKYLTKNQSLLYLLMANQLQKGAQITQKITNNRFITIHVKHVKRRLEIKKQKKGKLNVLLHMDLKVDITEDTEEIAHSKKEKNILDQKLEKTLTRDAKNTIKKMQEANCDALGIGRRLIAMYPHIWKTFDWEEEYPKAKIVPNMNIHITNQGILN